MSQERIEGTTSFVTDSHEKISAEMPVFYNPVMKRNRDFTLVLLAAMPTWMKAPIRIALPMEASGIRAARILSELVTPGVMTPAHISVNDRSEAAISFARRNVERNLGSYPSENVQLSVLDANLFLHAIKGAEYVDIDPFGTPNPFLDTAVQCVTRGGVIAVTATDTSALAGTYPRATQRKYWSVPSRTWVMHELGLRILIRKVQLVAAQYDIALVPVLSLATDHYYRVFLRNDGTSANKTKVVLDQHQMVHVDTEKHAVTVAHNGETGPLWVGPLQNETVIGAMSDALSRLDPVVFKNVGTLLALIKDEAHINALGFVDLHELSSTLGIQCPRRDVVLEKLGDKAARTHLCAHGFVTSEPIENVVSVLRSIQN